MSSRQGGGGGGGGYRPRIREDEGKGEIGERGGGGGGETKEKAGENTKYRDERERRSRHTEFLIFSAQIQTITNN